MGNFKFCLLALLVCTLVLPGCGGGSSVSITLTPNTTQTIDQGQTVAITAAVANDSTNQGVSWTLSGVGSLSGATTTSVTYVAPNILSTDTSVTVTATSVAKTTVTATLSISLNAILTITTTSLPIATLGQPYVGVISADGGSSPFNWVLLSGNLPPGLALSQSTSNSVTISGTPTALGTSSFSIGVTDSQDGSANKTFSITVNPKPPLAIQTKTLPDGIQGTLYSFTLQAVNGTTPYAWTLAQGSTLPPGLSLNSGTGVISGTPTTIGTSNFTVQVTDSTQPNPQTATADLSLTINASTVNDALLNGNYAFMVNGFDASGRFVAAGSFVADGQGTIVSGVMDTNDPANVQTSLALGGTYMIDTSGLGTISFTGAGRTFAVSVNPGVNPTSKGSIIEFDNNAHASGVFLKQNPTAFALSSITGNYAFGMLGVDGQGARYGLAGQFAADGAGNFSAGALDSDSAIAGPVANTGVTGTYTAANTTTGRGTATITLAGPTTTNYSYYVVDGTQLLLMDIDQVSGQPRAIVGGNVLQQSGSFGQNSFNGTGVFETTASPAQGQVGLLTGDGSANITLNSDLNTGGTLTSETGQGTYTVNPANGRTTLSNSGFQTSDPVLYLTNANQGFIIGTDPAVTFGFITAQVGPGSFSAASLSGTYPGGSVPPITAAGNTEVDIATADGVSAIDFITDSSSTAGTKLDQTSGSSFTVASSGRGVLNNGGITSIIYMVSTGEFVELAPDANAMVEDFQQ